MGVLMALIRVVPRSNLHNSWLTEKLSSPQELMKDPFGYDGMPVSVFNVTIGVEETKAVAAHYLTMFPARPRPQTVWILRIESHDLLGLDIEVRETVGETGIADIDANHRDLIGDKGKFEVLTQRLHDAIRCGEDRLRVVGPIQIMYQIQKFVALTGEAIRDDTKSRCQRLLSDPERSGT
jgi:hypothetical protein